MKVWQHYALILVVLCLFTLEELNPFTLFVVVAAVTMRARSYQAPQWVYQLFGALVFGLSYLQNGFSVNPEMGLNILVAVVSLKLLEAKENRDWRMLTLGSFLIWATGSLFVKTPFFFFCALASFGLALRALVRALEKEVAVSWRDLGVWILRALPLAVLLFFFFPRFSSGLWSPPPRAIEGRVGFSEETRPGDVGELLPTGALAFHASVTPLPPREELYWRGSTLTGHDGWNWFPTASDEVSSTFSSSGRLAAPSWWRQELIHKKEVRRVFGLDRPLWWEAQGKQVEASESATLRLSAYKTLRRYQVVSGKESSLVPGEAVLKEALIASRRLPDALNSERPQDLGEAQRRLASYFQQNGFAYSLSPGKITSLGQFLQDKRGWCAHYASSTALILRAWNFPTRLVSGYLGGELNPHSAHFQVSEDDAHVWVESFDGERWQRIDPTLWIVPERGSIDGGEFFRRRGEQSRWRQWAGPEWWLATQRWIDHVNFRFLVWSEDFDQEQQRAWARELDLDLASFYSVAVWALLGTMGAFWGLELWRSHQRKTPEELRARQWQAFIKRLQKIGLAVSVHQSHGELRTRIRESSHPDAEEHLKWLQTWEETHYRSR